MCQITCDQCVKTIDFDVAADGLPMFWSSFAYALNGEPVIYTGADGKGYTTSYEVGNTYGRPHVALCPQCTEEQFPWV